MSKVKVWLDAISVVIFSVNQLYLLLYCNFPAKYLVKTHSEPQAGSSRNVRNQQLLVILGVDLIKTSLSSILPPGRRVTGGAHVDLRK